VSKSTPGQKGRPRPDPAVTLLLRRPPGHHTGQDGTPCDKAAPQLLSATTLWTDDGSSIRPPKKHFFQQTLCVPLETNAGGIVVFTQHWRVARKLGGCPLGREKSSSMRKPRLSALLSYWQERRYGTMTLLPW